MRRAIAMMFVHLSVCPSGTDVHCDYTVHFRADLSSLWISNVLGTLTPKHAHLLPTILSHFHLEERWGMYVQTKRRIKR